MEIRVVMSVIHNYQFSHTMFFHCGSEFLPDIYIYIYIYIYMKVNMDKIRQYECSRKKYNPNR